jgi:CxxC motif-containing protein
MTKNEMICIICPMGCRMTIVKNKDTTISAMGNNCSKGAEYAERELCNPTRTLPSTVKILNAPMKRLPVRTQSVIPKSKIMDCMRVIKAVSVKAPIKMGDVIIHDILGTGIDVIASRSMSVNN